MREVSKQFEAKLEEVIKTNRRFKELVHHQQNEQYETVILSNTTNSVFLIVDYYPEYDSLDVNEISSDDIKIIHKFLNT